jgi:biotin operon repressor
LLATTLILHNVGKLENIDMLEQQGVQIEQQHPPQRSSLSTDKH